jgi:hypothetical protein
MWPPGHLALGYVAASLASRTTRGRSPDALHLPWIVLGSQFPDLIDKPLSWTFGILPGGRTLAHSAFAAVAVAVVAVAVGRRLRSHAGVAFAAAYASHLVGDAIRPALAGDVAGLRFLLWPVVPYRGAPGEEVDLLARLASMSLSGGLTVELVLAGAVALLWLVDGAPGVGATLRALRGRSGPPPGDVEEAD